MVSLVPAPVRVIALAMAISTLSFAAGMAGDLSAPPPASGARVVVAIPPSAQAARVPQATPMLATRTAQAITIRPMHVALVPPRERRPMAREQVALIPAAVAPKSERVWSRPPDPKPVFAELVKQDFVKA